MGQDSILGRLYRSVLSLLAIKAKEEKVSRIFHLSDLHIARQLVPDARAFFRGLEGHNIEIWRAFRTHLLNRIREITDEDYIIIVTGDLTATGHKESLDLCEELLFDNPESTLSKEIGLRLPREKFFIIPGNHDTYGGEVRVENTTRKFNGRFYPKAEYPITKDLRLGSLDVAIIRQPACGEFSRCFGFARV